MLAEEWAPSEGADGESRGVLRKEIESMVASVVSLMPGDLHLRIGPEEMVDLIAYLRKAFEAGAK